MGIDSSNNNNRRHRPACPSPWRRALVKSTAVALVLMGMVAARAQAPIVVQFSHVVTADTAKGKAALRFKELAESRTGGRVRVEVYPNSQLYKDREELDALRLGSVQMIAPSLSKLGGLGGGEFGVFDLPFLFRDHAAFRAVANGPVGTALLATLGPGGLKGLAYWDNGFKVFTANRPLQAPGDFRNLKIRVQASRVLVAQMETLGAQPSVSPLISVYEALKSGQLDGQENVPVNITTQQLDQVQSHLIVSNHGYLAYAVIVNKAFWDKLPSGIRTTLEVAMRDATAYANSLAEADNARALEHLRSKGRLTFFTPNAQELAQWRTALAPVYQASERWIGSGTLAAVQAATGAPP